MCAGMCFDPSLAVPALISDIVERFQLALMLTIIAIRNVIEMSGSDIAFLPKSFMRGKSLIESIFSVSFWPALPPWFNADEQPVLFVIMSEMVVDWLKHAFIAKFNHVRASVYGRFADVLAKDVLTAGSISSSKRAKRRGASFVLQVLVRADNQNPVLLDQSPLVARRLGFASIPLACLVLRVSAQAIGMLALSPRDYSDDPPSNDWAWSALKWTGVIGGGIAGWACLVTIKIMLGLGLLSYSAVRRGGMEEREREDRVNDFGRAAVGESKEETVSNNLASRVWTEVKDDADYKAYNKLTAEYLAKGEELDAHPSPTQRSGVRQDEANGNTVPGGPGVGGGGGKKGKKWKLEEVERWTMVKRIW